MSDEELRTNYRASLHAVASTPPPKNFIRVSPNILRGTLFPDTLNLSSAINVTYLILNPCTRGKFAVTYFNISVFKQQKGGEEILNYLVASKNL
jgi:hypothetical protein